MNKEKLPPGFSWMEIIVPDNRLAEFRELKKQMISGDFSKLEAITDERERIATAGLEGLKLICEAIRKHPTTGQRYRLTRFLAGLYNGPEHPFDMTDLRGLDGSLRLACLAVLTLDSLGLSELHDWGVVTQDDLKQWFTQDRVFYRADARREAMGLYEEKYGENGHENQEHGS